MAIHNHGAEDGPGLACRELNTPQGVKGACLLDEQLEPVNLEYLSDRARAYVVGLEAKLRELREANTKLRDEITNGAEERARKLVTKEYRRGWEDCAAAFANTATKAINELRAAQAAASSNYHRPDDSTLFWAPPKEN